MAKKVYIGNCVICGKMFTSSQMHTKTCSPKCSAKLNINNVNVWRKAKKINPNAKKKPRIRIPNDVELSISDCFIDEVDGYHVIKLLIKDTEQYIKIFDERDEILKKVIDAAKEASD